VAAPAKKAARHTGEVVARRSCREEDHRNNRRSTASIRALGDGDMAKRCRFVTWALVSRARRNRDPAETPSGFPHTSEVPACAACWPVSPARRLAGDSRLKTCRHLWQARRRLVQQRHGPAPPSCIPRCPGRSSSMISSGGRSMSARRSASATRQGRKGLHGRGD
jgi:hypothetical protein